MTARTLVLLRHAKAETPGEQLDIERALAERGRADAQAAGVWLAAQGLRPQVVLSSPATRTRQTWHGVAIGLAESDPAVAAPDVRYENGLYFGGRTEVVDLLRAVPESVRTVLVIGHNPTMTDVSLLLRPFQEDAALEGLKTCGIAVHRAERAWSETEPGALPLVTLHTARA
ncbi:SixA phosphatase family protein [Jidongwangia harbinensis]|uniref:SixA phosphatase family protein n=1 Tax=Jidongwangia harbinensis TaxID=2878561 RepID=UPI001CDA1E69|nr:histidine phosphatase family protein [Jidongwangia harbinensis]MCA2212828.1 histidine phosphatase family protein [Jidongwangia harbinensis]